MERTTATQNTKVEGLQSHCNKIIYQNRKQGDTPRGEIRRGGKGRRKGRRRRKERAGERGKQDGARGLVCRYFQEPQKLEGSFAGSATPSQGGGRRGGRDRCFRRATAKVESLKTKPSETMQNTTGRCVMGQEGGEKKGRPGEVRGDAEGAFQEPQKIGFRGCLVEPPRPVASVDKTGSATEENRNQGKMKKEAGGTGVSCEQQERWRV